LEKGVVLVKLYGPNKNRQRLKKCGSWKHYNCYAQAFMDPNEDAKRRVKYTPIPPVSTVVTPEGDEVEVPWKPEEAGAD
jgi:hypothetical protein